MREIIRFAWGISSLGDFVVAMSEKGVVALEFSSIHTAMENALRIRFPDADLERSQEDLAGIMEVVAGAIDDPARGCDLSLDLSGTAYEVRIWLMLREIPSGETTTYSALAAKLGCSIQEAIRARWRRPGSQLIVNDCRISPAFLALRGSVFQPSDVVLLPLPITRFLVGPALSMP